MNLTSSVVEFRRFVGVINHDSMTMKPGHSKDCADSFQGKQAKRYVSGVLAIDVNCYSSLMGHWKRGPSGVIFGIG